MNRRKFYLLLIGLLIISNLATMFFMMQKRIRKPFDDGPKKVIIEKLAFDEWLLHFFFQKLSEQRGLVFFDVIDRAHNCFFLSPLKFTKSNIKSPALSFNKEQLDC